MKSFRRGNIIIQGTRTLCSATMDGLKINNLDEVINESSGINIGLILTTVSLVINISSLESGLITVPNIT